MAFANRADPTVTIKPMKLCITGGSGFIGRRMRRALADLGHQVAVLDLVDDPVGFRSTEHFIRGDIRDVCACREAVAGCERVLHLAANHQDFGISREAYFDVNVNGMITLCRAMADTGVKNLCFFSSVAVYGGDTTIRYETDTPRPEHAYGESKLAAEQVVTEWSAAAPERSALVIRPTVVFGPESSANVYKLIRQIVRHRYVPVGAGLNHKSLAYVENVVDATLYLWSVGDLREPITEPHNGIFNYVDAPDMTVAELDHLIFKELHRRPPPFRLPLWLGMFAALPFDIVATFTGWNLPVTMARVAKLNTPTRFSGDKVLATGFRPRVSLAEGLRSTIIAVAGGQPQR
jgi:nucleoside-diphosphate-sugar epimerase